MILLLGGTIEGRRIAQRLSDLGVAFVHSLAGRTSNPVVAGEVRIGGFGGVGGLQEYLRSQSIGTVIDATHPFAEAISANAAAACTRSGTPLIRVSRPGWRSHPSADSWEWVKNHSEAADRIVELGLRRVFLTVGRLHTLDYSAQLGRLAVCARVAEPPTGPLPTSWELLVARGPFNYEDELELMRNRQIDCLVTKDSGGPLTSAKLDAASQIGATVVVIDRAPEPPGGLVVPGAVEAIAALKL